MSAATETLSREPAREDGLIPFTGESVIDLVRFRARWQHADVAYTHLKDRQDDVATITYGELERRVLDLAARLQARGVVGERLILMYPPGIDYLVAYLATIFAGAIAVPVYEARTSSHFARLAGILQDSQPRYLLTDQATLRKTGDRHVVDGHGGGATWLCTDSDDDLPPPGRDWHPVQLAAGDLVFIQYTSGSTGTPKGVLVSNVNILRNSEIIRRAIEPHGRTLHVSWLPPYHDMGLIGGLMQPLYSGFPCVLMSPVLAMQRPIRLLRAIADYSATICGGPNFIYETCARRIRDHQLEGLDLSTWEVALNGAEPVSAKTLERFSARFAPYGFDPRAHFPCYGMAESTLFVSGAKRGQGAVVRRFDKAALLSGSAIETDDPGGQALVSSGTVQRDRLTVRIVDPEGGAEVDAGTIGEVWIRGESIAAGYWRRERVPGREFDGRLDDRPQERYLRTGDLGFFAGFELFITGRIKDLVIVNGANHYPQDIEWSVAESSPHVKPATTAAFSMPGDEHEALIVVQEVKPRLGDDEREALRRAIRSRVSSDHQLSVEDVLFVAPGTLPKTSSGKIRRHAARQLYLVSRSNR